MNNVIPYVCVFVMAVVHAWTTGKFVAALLISIKMLTILLLSLLGVKHELSSGKDIVNDQTKPSVGDCIRSKWQSVLSVYDVDRDGKLSVADLGQARKSFIKLNKLSGKDKKLRERKITKFWTDCILWNKQVLLKSDFGSVQRSAFLEDKNTYFENVLKCEKLYFGLVNMDNDVYLSAEEETTLLMAFGRTDVKKIKQFFKSLDPKGKGIPLTDQLTKWIEYFTNDDCSKSPVIFNLDE